MSRLIKSFYLRSYILFSFRTTKKFLVVSLPKMEACAFLNRHPGLTGFSEQNALFMTVKELLDNALDAVTSVRLQDSNHNVDPHNKNRNPFNEAVCPDVELVLERMEGGGSRVICKDQGTITTLKKFLQKKTSTNRNTTCATST